MNYNHITINERACIYQFKQLGMSIREIAKGLNRSPSTISRELKRNNCGRRYKYLPHIAQRKYQQRRINCHRSIVINLNSVRYIEEKIKINWSPEQIFYYQKGRPEQLPSVSTMYRWIKRGLLINGDTSKLRRKGKMTDKKETRGKFNIGKRIKKRPKEVYSRETFGHWEADTVVSGRNDRTYKSSYCFVTLAERKSRLYLCKQLPNRQAENVTNAIIELLSQFPPNFVKTITCDRGKEFAGWEEIEQRLNCEMYFADPFCAWQKGTNENSNGLLREYYPKGINLISEFMSFLVLMLFVKDKKIRKKDLIPNKKEIKNIFSIAIPTTTSRLVGSISYFFEPIIITTLLLNNGYDIKYIIEEYGIIEGFVLPLLLMPSFLTNALSSALIPDISKKYVKGDILGIKRRIKHVVKISLIIGIVISIILYINPEFYLLFIYKTNKESNYLKILIPFFILLYLQYPFESILQGLNKSKSIMKNNVIGIIFKILLIIILSFLNIGLYNLIIAIIANITITTLLHLRKIKEVLY